MSWAPDSARIATGEGDGLVVVWNARTGERELTFHGEPGYRIET
jgi:WD40 repeat protein